MKTSRGIYYVLEESEYILSIDNLDFYFSSNFYLEKFKNKWEDFVKCENKKIGINYNCIVDFKEMLLISLYTKIEKRGFLVRKNNKNLTNFLYKI